MSRLAKHQKSQRLEKATVAQAQARTEALRSAYRAMETDWLRLGMATQTCIDAHVPEALGLTAHAWGESVFGEGWSKIKRARQAFNGLKHLPEAEISELSEGNAVNLSRLPPKMQADLLEKAKHLSVKEFREEVASRLESKGVPRTKARHFDGINMAEDRYELVMEQFKRSAEILGKDPEEPSTRSLVLWAWASSISQTVDVLLRSDWGEATGKGSGYV